MEMFNALNFKPRYPNSLKEGMAARVFFSNGYGACVLFGEQFYCSKDRPYELLILKGTEDSFTVPSDTEIGYSGSVGYQTDEEIDSLLRQISNL